MWYIRRKICDRIVIIGRIFTIHVRMSLHLRRYTVRILPPWFRRGVVVRHPFEHRCDNTASIVIVVGCGFVAKSCPLLEYILYISIFIVVVVVVVTIP